MEMVCCSLYSGSSGNAFYIGCGDTQLLIDCGKSGRQTEEALRFLGVEPDALTGILVTHEHRDHIAGIGVMSRKYHIPVYATEKTWAAIGDKVGAFPRGMQRVFERESDFYIGGLGIVPFPVSHDAADPCGFRVYDGAVSVALATDFGFFSKEMLLALSGADVILLESNHDPDMVWANPHYTYALKQRILGRRGHMSNADSAEALMALADKGTRHFILGHMSQENNTPNLALLTSETRAELDGLENGRDLWIDRAWRERVGNLYRLNPTGVLAHA